MHSTDAQAMAFKLYCQHRNLKHVAKLMKKDYGVSLSTLNRWKADNKEEWEKAAEQYVINLAKEQARLATFEQDWARRFAGMCDIMEERFQEGNLSQNAHAAQKLVDSVLKLKDRTQEIDLRKNKEVSLVINELLSDEVLGPIMQKRAAIILERVKKKLEHGRT